MLITFRSALLASVACLVGVAASADSLRLITQSDPSRAQYPAEIAALDALQGDGFAVTRNEYQALGVNLADGLRLISSGAFDMATIQVGSVAKDDPFLEGIDLIGVSTDMGDLKGAVDAYRDVFNARLEEKFGVTAAAIWPFGPQVFLCNSDMTSLADLKGLKVRSFTASMSTLLENLGATPVTLSFPEVYPALQRGVASCGVTSPTSSNSGKWPEVTTHLYPLSVSGSVQAHVVNLAWLNGLSAEDRAGFDKAMAAMEAELWNVATSTNDTAQACSTGGDCPEDGIYTSYDMTLVPVSDDDKAQVAEIAVSKILPEWAATCESSYPGCTSIWNETVGAARGLTIE
ncbi:TRAP transporter substrate-binding protein [Tritonibacter horizontis]|uniref:C4-dicarboxylate-binding periplasmic protein n=1 Tax=Tritonibacter horizontis TaxID=1768241 RepID=A0A132BYD6_9RHOB|nr:TRAP transporter substrate-binding protein [Tritonibacter horizontis]KUP93206.1 C4-dicarboxylate-binding periplasmic protein precursor [Tritonibacter horizontis]